MSPTHPHTTAGPDTLEVLAQADTLEQRRSFRPRALRLSSSFSSFGAANGRLDTNFSIRKWKAEMLDSTGGSPQPPESMNLAPFFTSSHKPLHSLLPDKLSLASKTSRHRLRTQSLDRKGREQSALIARRHMSLSSCSSRGSCGPGVDHSFSQPYVRRASGLPIHRSDLSFVPSKRHPSIDETASMDVTTQTSEASRNRRNSDTLSGETPHSTVGTSVDSHVPSTRPPYKPRPLLLTTFGAHNRVKASPTTKDLMHNSPLSCRLAHSTYIAQHSLSSTTSGGILVGGNSGSHSREVHLQAKETKLKMKRAREAELAGISSCINGPKLIDGIPEADDDDCWSWLSGSDAGDASADDEAEMAVVWRASLDVGRRVSKDRKALGKGHGIRMPPKIPIHHTSNTRDEASNHSTVGPSRTTVRQYWPSNRLAFLLPMRCSNFFSYLQHFVLKHAKLRTSKAFLLGSGFLGGIISSLLFSIFSGPGLLSLQQMPFSKGKLGFFLRLAFPHRTLGSSTIALMRPSGLLADDILHGGMGLYTCW